MKCEELPLDPESLCADCYAAGVPCVCDVVEAIDERIDQIVAAEPRGLEVVAS